MKHLINKVSLMVAVDRRAKGYALNQELGHWFLSDMVPELEALFEQLIPDNQLLRIDQLDLELPLISMKDWREKLRTAILEALETQINLLLSGKGANTKLLPSTQGHFEAWLYFLSQGNLPPYYAAASEQVRLEAVLQEVAARRSALEQLLKTLRNNPQSVERLVKQHTPIFLTRLAGAVCGKSLEPLFEAFQALGNWMLEQDFQRMVFKHVPGAKSKSAAHSSDFSSPVSVLSSQPQPGTPKVVRALTQKFWEAFFQQIVETGGLIHEEPFLKKILWSLFKEIYGIDVEYFIQKLNTSKATKHNTMVQTRVLALHSRFQGLPTFARQVSEVFLPKLSMEASEQLDDKLSNNPGLSMEKTVKTSSPTTEALEPEISKPTSAINDQPTQHSESTSPFDESTHLGNPSNSDTLQPDSLHGGANTPAPKDTHNFEELPDETPQFLQNAGLVLLHPFLTHLFEHCAYLEGKDFKSDYARIQAIQLLHYIATGMREAPEYELYLPKILCSWEMSNPVEREFLPEPEHVAEAESMMQAAIQHWGALGKVSNDSLRQGFLQRPGKISRREDHYLLQVEPQTLDILLQKLPWGMGIFKLPWMKNLLHVEWNV
ncbi:contractile injection system tape measure protein [Haliscomenobacter sp.]|uniref:contractile injection system tape measure protein n=1 Tax=Haliscomenobacter sp. TaxID=2717303 RepID=UPI003BAB743E